MISKVRGSRWTALAAVPVMVLGLTLFSATAAQASIGTLTVDTDSRTNAGGDRTESETAECPTGAVVIGTGWSATGRTVVNEAVPDSSTGTVRVQAFEQADGATFPNWAVTAKAICATGITGVEVVNNGPSTFSSDSSRSDFAECPFGKEVVGVGFDIGISASEGEVHLTSIVPTSNRVTVTAHEDDNGTAQSWGVTAYAVCATEPFGLEIVTSPSPATGFDATTCPSGKTAIGGGGVVDGAEDDVNLNGVKIGSYAGQEFATVSAQEDRDGTISSWETAATVICANT